MDDYLLFIIIGVVIFLIILMMWLYFAWGYRISVERLCRLAGQKFTELQSNDIQTKYLIQCNQELSRYDPEQKKFHAVFTFKPDLKNPNAPAKPNATKTYNIIEEYNDCLENITACIEENIEACSKQDARIQIVKESSCININ
jgi:hypothetical protein